MKRINSIALCIHHTRLNDAVDLIKAHTTECSTFELIYGGEQFGTISSACGINITLFTSNFRQWDQKLIQMMECSAVRGIIYLGEENCGPANNPVLSRLVQTSINLDIPLALNLSSAEALIHLMSDYPEALSGHHIAAQYLEDMAYQH